MQSLCLNEREIQKKKKKKENIKRAKCESCLSISFRHFQPQLSPKMNSSYSLRRRERERKIKENEKRKKEKIENRKRDRRRKIFVVPPTFVNSEQSFENP